MKVLVDVMNFSIRAFRQLTDETLPIDEMERIIYVESGGKIPEIEPIDIYPTLLESDKKKIEPIIGMINVSGLRGTMEVK